MPNPSEQSGYWNTSGTPSGHQVTGYDQSAEAWIAAVAAHCGKYEGVAYGYLNSLEVTSPGANTIQINSGGAIVDGIRYRNGSQFSYAAIASSTGGSTRIDRVVLRVVWASFTASIYVITGVNDVAPTPPAIASTSGSTYDIKLYQLLINSSGTIVLTDERNWARPKLDTLEPPTDVTTLNVSASAHGLAPKLSGVATQALLGDGSYGNPTAGAAPWSGLTGRPASISAAGFSLFISGGGGTITTGLKGIIEIPYACNITNINILDNMEVGSISIDINKTDYANFPSSSAVGTYVMTSAYKAQSTVNLNFAAGDILIISVGSVTSCTAATISLRGTKS